MEVGTPDREPGESAPFPRASATGTGFPGGGLVAELERAAAEDRAGHLFAFYQRVGFEVLGVIPDANGPGKPDILMAKRVRPHA